MAYSVEEKRVRHCAASKRYHAAHPYVSTTHTRARSRAWYQRNKDHIKEYNLNRDYGLSTVSRLALLERQGNQCASCHRQTPAHKNGWFIDHNHKTGKVRGIICCRCNSALAVLENIQLMTELQEYLGADNAR